MKYIFISQVKPLNSLLDFDILRTNIDLHNCFDCEEIAFSKKSIEFTFKKVDQSTLYSEQNLIISFSDIIEYSVNNEALLTKPDFATVVNFARGDFLPNNKYYNEKAVKYFFIEFENGLYIEVFCKDAIVILWD